MRPFLFLAAKQPCSLCVLHENPLLLFNVTVNIELTGGENHRFVGACHGSARVMVAVANYDQRR